MSSTEAAPAYAPTQEMRFAVVLYGGVSLAIYIHGVVQELLALVRATAPSATGGTATDPLLADGTLTGTEAVYRRLGRMLAHGPQKFDPDAGDGPIRTRFVVDILSGT